MLIDYIKEHYEEGEPFFIEDINIEGIKRDNFRQQLKTLADTERIKRYEKGIYYIPRKTDSGSSDKPNPETVAIYKYISRRGKTDGYFSGSTFANLLGVSLQVPMKKEIVSNNTSAIVREIRIGKQSFIVRRSNIYISEENVRVLQLLDLLKNLDSYLDISYEEARKIIRDYSLANNITLKDIDKYIRQYPDSTFRYYYEMRLNSVLT